MRKTVKAGKVMSKSEREMRRAQAMPSYEYQVDAGHIAPASVSGKVAKPAPRSITRTLSALNLIRA